MFVDEKGEFKSFIAKIVKEPDMFTEWMRSIGVSGKNEDEKFVSSEECSHCSDESMKSDESSEKEAVFDKPPSDSGSSDESSENQ
ncbi:hypothetical protein Hanom_Chr12g01130791 [Helianthus anomalus]